MLDIKDFLEDILKEKYGSDFKNYHTGKLETEEYSIFITNDVEQDDRKMYNAKFERQNISIIIHWNDSYTITRQKALEIYNYIKSLRNVVCDENIVIVHCIMDDDFPTDFKSKNTIYAQEISFQVLYAKI